MPIMSSKFQEMRLAMVGAVMVNRSVRLLVTTAVSEVARALTSAQATVSGSENGNRAIRHYAEAIIHLRAAASEVDMGREFLNRAVSNVYKL